MNTPLKQAFVTLLASMVSPAVAAPAGGLLGKAAGKAGDSSLGVSMQIVVLLTLLTLLPAIVMSITPFLRISIVLHFLRQALGTQTDAVQPGAAGDRAVSHHAGYPARGDGHVPPGLGADGEQPDHGRAGLRRRHAAVESVPDSFCAREGRQAVPRNLALRQRRTTRPIWICTILIPAYILSELKAGFQIGAVLFLPFLIIDLVVASVTLSVGMVQLPPVMISAPFKILLFVLADGWNLVIGSLVKGLLRMTPEFVIQIHAGGADDGASGCSAPLLAVGFVAGIIMSLIQILTSIQDSAFNAIPRLLAFLAAFVLAMPWMLQKMTVYMTGILGDLSRYGH